MVKNLIITIFVLSFTALAPAATLYMGSGETYTNLQSAMAAMAGGDTLIIKDNTYTGATNVIAVGHTPPNGSVGAYTTIQAETVGGVIFDGENARSMCTVWGPAQSNHVSYIQFEGITWRTLKRRIENDTNTA